MTPGGGFRRLEMAIAGRSNPAASEFSDRLPGDVNGSRSVVNEDVERYAAAILDRNSGPDDDGAMDEVELELVAHLLSRFA